MNRDNPQDTGWVELKSRHRHAVLDRLLEREWAYVPITAHLLESAPLLNGRPFNLFVTHHGTEIADVVLRANDGLLLVAFADRGSPRENGAQPGGALGRMIAAPGGLHSSMGLTLDVTRVERLLRLRPLVYVDHALMTMDREDLSDARPVPDGVGIRRATVRDTERLLPLREAYELEEVILDPSRFNRDDCRRRLRQSLRSDLVYLAEHHGRPVATAATSTRGVHVDQIGGVFTTETVRRRGLGTAVILALLHHIFHNKPQACLFVKTKNLAAQRLYERLGFSSRGGYRISYYR